MAKASKKPKKAGGPIRNLINRKAVQFVRSHLETRLVQAGFDRDKAAEMTVEVEDQEIQDHLGQQKVGALGDGGFLKWLSANRENIKAAVEKLFMLLSLFAEPKSGEAALDSEEETSGEEHEEEKTDEADESEEE